MRLILLFILTFSACHHQDVDEAIFAEDIANCLQGDRVLTEQMAWASSYKLTAGPAVSCFPRTWPLGVDGKTGMGRGWTGKGDKY